MNTTGSGGRSGSGGGNGGSSVGEAGSPSSGGDPPADALLDLVRPDVARVVERIGTAIRVNEIRVVHEVREGDRRLLFAGCPGGTDHAVVLFEVAPDGGIAGCHVGVDGTEVSTGEVAFETVLAPPVRRPLPSVKLIDAEPGASEIHLRSWGDPFRVPVDPSLGLAVHVAWDGGRPVHDFTAVTRDGETVPVFDRNHPFSDAFAADCWTAVWSGGKRSDPNRPPLPTVWIGDIFHELEGEAFWTALVRLLRASRLPQHERGIAHLGTGPIYGSGHHFYDLVEQDAEIPPETLYYALLYERPQFLPPDVASRYARLMDRLARRIGEERAAAWRRDVQGE